MITSKKELAEMRKRIKLGEKAIEATETDERFAQKVREEVADLQRKQLAGMREEVEAYLKESKKSPKKKVKKKSS